MVAETRCYTPKISTRLESSTEIKVKMAQEYLTEKVLREYFACQGGSVEKLDTGKRRRAKFLDQSKSSMVESK